MVIPKINSAHGSDTRNILNRAIDLINAQGKSIQDLVAEGQLTPEEYAQLINIVNGTVKKGNITTADIDKNNFAIDQTMITDSLRSMITGDTPINAVPADGSITRDKLAEKSVDITKTDFSKRTDNLFDGVYIDDMAVRVSVPWTVIEASGSKTAVVPILPGKTYYIRRFEPSDRFRIATTDEFPQFGHLITGQYLYASGDYQSFVSGTNEKFLIIQVSSSNQQPKITVTEGYDEGQHIPYSIISSEYIDNSFKEELRFGESLISGFSNHSLSPVTGKEGTDSARVRTSFTPVGEGHNIELLDTVNFGGFSLFKYDMNKSFIESTGYVNKYTIKENGFVRIVSRLKNGGTISNATQFDNKFKLSKSLIDSLPSNIIDNITSGITLIQGWESGQIAVINGENYADITRVRTSNYYKVSKGQMLKFKQSAELDGMMIYFYDLDKNYLTNVGYVHEYEFEDDFYIRVISRYSDSRVITDYSAFDNLCTITPGEESSNRQLLFGNFNNLYKSDPIKDMSLNSDDRLSSKTFSDIYGEYDALMSEYPLQITKQLLGHGTLSGGGVDNNLPIYEYTFHSPYSDRLEYSVPTILIQTGLHGNEKSPVWSLLEFFRQMFSKSLDDDTLDAIKNSAIYKVIPIANPGGFNVSARRNNNDVDVNRNFSYKWDMYAGDEKGTAPYSEEETKVLRDWYAENSSENAHFVDFHNTGEAYQASYLDTHNPTLRREYSQLMIRLSGFWIDRYSEIGNNGNANEAYGFLSASQSPMTYNEANYVAGIEKSALLEIAWDADGVYYSSKALERGVDLVSNYIQILLRIF